MKTDSEFMRAAELCLKDAHELPADDLDEQAIALASWMLQEGNRTQTSAEKSRQEQLAAMIEDPIGKTFTSYMADQCFRTKSSSRIADQLVYLLDKFGIPQYLTRFKRLQMKFLKLLAKPFSSVMIPAVAFTLRKETESVILSGEDSKLSAHIAKRHKEGVRINLNHLGEAILSEEEALKRLQIYVGTLKKPEVEYVSIKISTIYSQINLLAWEETLEILAERLRVLYRTAKENAHIRPDGSRVQKFVNLDMEEYRDLRLTVELFKKLLSEEEFKSFSAGIVLQAYIPDSYLFQKELTEWAIQRCLTGGAPIKIRIVKGANLAMEKVEASLRGWEQAPYQEKIDVDANFKRMLIYGCEKAHASAVHLGIGSHNLFDIAFGMLLRQRNGVEKEVCFEMLEGMAAHLSRVVQNLTGGMLLYCPAAKRDEFQNAIAYLIRRLDENTAPDNFLRHAFGLQKGSPAWEHQIQLFKKAFERISTVSEAPRRVQNRKEAPEMPAFDALFQNEADTDFSLPQNQEWGREIVRSWSKKEHPFIPLTVGGEDVYTADKGSGQDPSRPGKLLYQFAMANEEQVELALKTAVDAGKEWSAMSVAARSEAMAQVAQGMRRHRADLIGAMVADAGKTLAEADVEVSEAIDMAEYYRKCREELEGHKDLRWTPKGVVLVIPPWNFPCAIPAGGIIAALMAGNAVIFKPARETILVASVLAHIFWEAGISKKALQFLTGSSSVIGKKLITDPRINAVILTGSTATGKHFLKMRPGLHLMAETGGKNSLIVTNLADKDLAIKDIIHSAFSHAGQKCSAASLLILEKEVYEDLHFLEQLRDAAASLKVGPSWELTTKVNPLIHPPEQDLERGLKTVEPGESWLLQPKQDPNNPNLWSPGIKLGVKEGSFMHQTELFGPVLGVMCAQDLKEAIRFANGTRYGLTAGLHTLDEREHSVWQEGIEAGNCYINRGITGAIVRRQPFGGCKESCFGPGPKAGGPNYLIPLMNVEQISLPLTSECPVQKALIPLEDHLAKQGVLSDVWAASLESYLHWGHQFRQDQDPSQILGQDNFLRYIPHKGICVRWQPGNSSLDLARVCAAAIICNVPLQLSLSANESWPTLPGIEIVREEEAQFLSRIREGKIKRLRLLSPPTQEITEAAATIPCYISQTPVLANGRVELLHYLREMSISLDYHRYGNIGIRETLSEMHP